MTPVGAGLNLALLPAAVAKKEKQRERSTPEQAIRRVVESRRNSALARDGMLRSAPRPESAPGNGGGGGGGGPSSSFQSLVFGNPRHRLGIAARALSRGGWPRAAAPWESLFL